MRAPTGEQFDLTWSDNSRHSSAIITEVAAGIRALEVGGTALIERFPADSTPPFAAGTVLSPWPNRNRDGLWQLDGKPQQLDITEVAAHNAIHGLLRSRPYRVQEREDHAITLAATVHPQHGYPFLVDTLVRYELVPGGLRVSHTFTNVGAVKAPVAVGAHPFLRVGDTPIEHLTLQLDVESRFLTDERLNPIGEEPVEGTRFDLRGGVMVADLDLDDAFSSAADADGISRHRLTAPDGQFTELWQGHDFGYVQAFTPRTFPRPTSSDLGAVGLAIAIEPMTAPPNAFNSGLGVIWLQPGEAWTGSWGVTHGRE
ncbi:MAG: aldose 1-epimerase family protein [Terrimesophilobacter sp.]